ncbi:putative neural-cadherin 2 [Homarus americanus]|uniref:putative neural-cadherin 2 n=1 Tax=Homarus americanus TaxID=6706 RepID=UPI001C463CEE|nr:putative neural-cadherin 2 [Homarus americanus]
MIALQLVGGQPQVMLEGARGPMKLQVNTTLSTGTWHTLHLHLNPQLVDLGEPAYSNGSVKGCRPQEMACQNRLASCSLRGHCVNGVRDPKCDCKAGWTGPRCTTPTVPVTFGQASYVKIALHFTPDPFDVSLQFRIRTRGRTDGLLLQLTAIQQSNALRIRLRGGIACASVSGGVEWVLQEVCLESFPLGDGSWHTIRVGRHGHNLVISVDDGNGWRQNETLTSLLTTTVHGEMKAVVDNPPRPLTVDTKYGTIVGGIPEFVNRSLLTVHDDLHTNNFCSLQLKTGTESTKGLKYTSDSMMYLFIDVRGGGQVGAKILKVDNIRQGISKENARYVSKIFDDVTPPFEELFEENIISEECFATIE